MKQGLLLKAYGMLWGVLTPFLHRNARLADGWKERRIPVDWLAHVPWAMRERRGCDIWLQAASGGEARLALAVLAALPRRERSGEERPGEEENCMARAADHLDAAGKRHTGKRNSAVVQGASRHPLCPSVSRRWTLRLLRFARWIWRSRASWRCWKPNSGPA